VSSELVNVKVDRCVCLMTRLGLYRCALYGVTTLLDTIISAVWSLVFHYSLVFCSLCYIKLANSQLLSPRQIFRILCGPRNSRSCTVIASYRIVTVVVHRSESPVVGRMKTTILATASLSHRVQCTVRRARGSSSRGFILQ